MRYASPDVKKFIADYFKNLPKYKSYPEAYEATEIEYLQKNHKRKYKNWATFQVILHRYNKNT